MRFNASKSAFAAAVSAAARSVATRATQTAFMSIRLELLEDGSLIVTGTDGETTTSAVCATSDFEAGTVAVSGHQLADLVRDLPDGDITVKVADGRVAITAPSGTYRIPVFAETPPAAPTLGAVTFTISGPSLAAAVASLAPIARGSEGIFSTVKLQRHEDKLRFVSTDRYRLGLVEIAVQGTDGWQIDANVPVKSLADLTKLFGRSETVSIAAEPTGFGATDGTTTMITRYAGGDWPTYGPLLERERIGRVDIDADALAASIRRVARFASSSGAPASVKLTFAEGNITVSAGGDGEATENVACTGTAPALELFANAQYLADAIDGSASTTVTVSPTGPTSPLFIEGVYRHMVMPTRG